MTVFHLDILPGWSVKNVWEDAQQTDLLSMLRAEFSAFMYIGTLPFDGRLKLR